MEGPKPFKLCPTNLTSLLFDEACLQVTNRLSNNVQLRAISSECYECDPIKWYNLKPHSDVSLVVPAVYNLKFNYFSKNQTYCPKEISFQQHGLYQWFIDDECMDVGVLKEPDNPYIPLYIFLAILFGFVILVILSNIIFNSHFITYIWDRNNLATQLENDLGSPDGSGDSVAGVLLSELVPTRRVMKKRIQSLDAFRGLTITLMIFVNYGGGKYWFFKHSPWNGLTIADLVFPWFAWIMGLSLVLRYRSQLRARIRRRNVLLSSFGRAVVLFTLGFTLNSLNNYDMRNARIPGVLQRLAVAHVVIATLEILFIRRQPAFQFGRFLDILESWRQWIVVLSLTVLHTYLTFSLHVPGCPDGYLGPGGLHEHSKYINCTGGATGYIDRQVFGDRHIYQSPTSKHIYHSTLPFDPEGLLGALTTCLTVYLGVQAGQIVLCYPFTRARVVRWNVWALITFVSAGFLCNWSQEDGLIPINKNLWSLSFVLLTASLAFYLLSMLFLIIDHMHWWSGAPFTFAGMNPLLLYVGHIFMKDTFPWRWKPTVTTSHNEYLTMNVTGTILWLCIATFLYRKNFFLSI